MKGLLHLEVRDAKATGGRSWPVHKGIWASPATGSVGSYDPVWRALGTAPPLPKTM